MEDKDFKRAEDISGLLSDGPERIAPDIISKKYVRIRPYFLLTISSVLFIFAFVFADIGAGLVNKENGIVPSFLASEVLGGYPTDNELTLSEYLVSNVLGINKLRADEIAELYEYAQKDEHIKDNPATDTSEISVGEIPIETSDVELPSKDSPEEDSNLKKYPIISMDLSQRSLGEYYIGNETTYKPDIKALLEKDSAIPAFSEINSANGPLVLILHTHGTESYAEDGELFYVDDGRDISRTDDTEKNVVAIGKLMADILNENGIGTVHCTIMHDKESYQDSYTRAAETIRRYLTKYPSIKYVFDVHRDAILKSDGALVKAVTEINGESVAQVMSVVGSNYKGADFKDWEERLSLALKLKSKLSEKYPSLSRPVYLRGAAYNQQYAKGSMLLEIGSSGNTLDEAKSAAKLVALALVDIIKGK
ncbi:MAG: hypothetical protein E7623_02280 [Ruminococcaceae bacterium]|nr:hypothetical protein [Oscillospiraceae bacterium]